MKIMMRVQPGWTFIGLLKNIFFLMLFLAFVPTLFFSIKHSFSDLATEKVEIGFISMRGMIADSVGYVKRIEEFAKNPDIKGLLLKIDSPGGYPGASQAILHEVLKFKEKKPVVVFIENVCASAAYYIACGAHKVFTTPSAMVGSIGVFIKIPNVEGLLDSWKVKTVFVQSGSYKTAGEPLKKIDDRDLAHLQLLSDETYNQFVKDVAMLRGIDIAAQLEWADGKVFSGNQAVALRLVDAVGYHGEALDEIKKMANIEGEVRLVTAKHPAEGIMKYLSGEEEYGSEASSSFAARCGQFAAQAYAAFMSAVASPARLAA